MTQSKKHHYVPQSYIRLFAHSNFKSKKSARVWAYHKLSKNIISKSPAEIAHENHFHTVKGLDDPEFIEKIFASEVEPKFLDAIRLTTESAEKISAIQYGHKMVMANHLAYQIARHPQSRELIKAQLDGVNEALIYSASLLTGKYGDLKVNTNVGAGYHMIRALDSQMIGTLENILLNQFWQILKAPPYLRFISSDNPVASYRGGIGTLGNVIFFPLNPRYAILMRDPRILRLGGVDLEGEEGKVIQTDEGGVLLANFMQILNSKYHSFSSAKNFSYIDLLTSRFPKYFEASHSRVKYETIPASAVDTDGKIKHLPHVTHDDGLALSDIYFKTEDLPYSRLLNLVREIYDNRPLKNWQKTFMGVSFGDN